MHSEQPRALLLDMDGLLYHGDRPLPGARRLLTRLAETPHVFVTNNPIRTPEQIADALGAMGLPRPHPERIITSALATARWLAQWRENFRYFCVGAGSLDAALRRVGQPDSERADVVVIGEGPGLDFEQLTIGINLILSRGARLVATNPDPSVDGVRNGRHVTLPGGGALVAPFAAATGVTPTFVGKPEPLLYEMALALLDCPAGACLMVGDRPDTDIAGAERLGMWTALVRSGQYPPGRPWPTALPQPDYDCDDLSVLMNALDRDHPGLLSPERDRS
ncbi:haloacid dehalogenase [Thiocapsa imhoffii]|uniref:Haloacid dehalogenase n=1 Tax=Thiocapsa imhoffii TaxID=382777 RepID=A0A9X0WF57_9GAMM|nr:HAD-IIA family hydrolase [Thiocapsa imhoffii]MBK1643561.1 haloacid dehalogenase [Thiocapsa imhoffii]